MIKSILLTLKFVGLGYLALILQGFITAHRSPSWFKKAIGLAAAVLLLALPVWAIMSVIGSVTGSVRSAGPRTGRPPAAVVATSPPVLGSFAPSARVSGLVTHIVNGDTIDVILDDGTTERVRLLGMDAPESGVCFYAESGIGAVNLLQDQRVWLEADSRLPNRDIFGRLWRYVRLPDDRLANQVLIEQGFAFEYTYFTAHDYQAEFEAAEAQAREQVRGIWADSVCSIVAERPEHIFQTISWQMPSDLPRATVTRVIDGDTVEVVLGSGEIERVRLIGIDTPERGRCYFGEATDRQITLTDTITVLLEADPSQDNRDAFGRLLRYIWLPDGTLVNAVLIAEGYAYEYTYRLPYRYTESFMQLEHEAHIGRLGLWGPETCDGVAGRRFSRAYNTN